MQTVDFRIFRLHPGDILLDLGCGEGRHVIGAYYQENVQAVGVDLSLKDLQTARDRFQSFGEYNNHSGSHDDHTNVSRDNHNQTNNSQKTHGGNDTDSNNHECNSNQYKHGHNRHEHNSHQEHDTSKSFNLSVASALQLPFADNTFDKVICSEVLEHIQDFQRALQEIERVLKPGGLFCASVPRQWPEKICWTLSEAYHKVEGGHLRIFQAGKLKAHIESLGLKCFHRHWAHALHSPFWWLKCLFWRTQDNNWLIKQYHRFLVWDLMDRPLFTRLLETLLNPVMGKSVVMYFKKEVVQ